MINQEKVELKKFLDYLQDKIDDKYKAETQIAIKNYLYDINFNKTIEGGVRYDKD